MDQLIGTIQKVTILRDENGYRKFYVLEKHKGRIPVSKKFYPNFRKTVKKYIRGLKNGEVIDCEIIKINKRKDCFILKLVNEPPTN